MSTLDGDSSPEKPAGGPAKQCTASSGGATVSLTTPQKKFFNRKSYPERWIVPFRFETGQDQQLQPGALREALSCLIDYRPVLRSRFFRRDGRWDVDVAPAEGPIPLYHEDLSGLSDSEQLDRLEAAWHRTELEFKLLEGPHIKVGLYELGQRQALHIFVNHSVVDAVSAFLLLEDLQEAYLQIVTGEKPALTDTSEPIGSVALAVERHALEKEKNGELDYWLSLPWDRISPLPLDFPAQESDNTYASIRQVTGELPAGYTAIMRRLPRTILGMNLSDALLMALTETITAWTDGPWMEVTTLDGRGQTLYCEGDASRTVGWISHSRILVLKQTGASDPLSRLQQFFKQLQDIPGGGDGFEMLRWNSRTPGIFEKLDCLPKEEILLNHLGDLNSVATGIRAFGELKGTRRPKAVDNHQEHEKDRALHTSDNISLREAKLLVTTYLQDGRLVTHWEYSSNLHTYETIRKLAEGFISILKETALAIELSP